MSEAAIIDSVRLELNMVHAAGGRTYWSPRATTARAFPMSGWA